MSQRLAGVKGMNDILPGDVELWQHIEAVSRSVLQRYGFAEVRTPVLEETALFVRSVGEETDIVGKEMYTFQDKGGRSLSLRPEGTAPAVRSYVEHAVIQKEPVTRWFYLGPMFRYERMKTGRYRQFFQLGAEAFGVRDPTQDVELMEMVVHFLEQLELKGVSLELNSLGDDACRPDYQKKLVDYLNAHKAELCADCQGRLERNPMRVLDCKNERCKQLVAGAPASLEHLCPACKEHFDEVRRQLDLLGISYRLNKLMVRGLDYYTRTAFELIAADPVLGTASAVGGGGRYDKLVKELGGPDVPAVGFALGLDRLCLLLRAAGKQVVPRPQLFVVSVDSRAQGEALKLVTRLRRQGLWVELDARGGSVKSQMKRADKSGARFTIVLGESELNEGAAELKEMLPTGASGQERPPARKVRLDELDSVLKAS